MWHWINTCPLPHFPGVHPLPHLTITNGKEQLTQLNLSHSVHRTMVLEILLWPQSWWRKYKSIWWVNHHWFMASSYWIFLLVWIQTTDRQRRFSHQFDTWDLFRHDGCSINGLINWLKCFSHVVHASFKHAFKTDREGHRAYGYLSCMGSDGQVLFRLTVFSHVQSTSQIMHPKCAVVV